MDRPWLAHYPKEVPPSYEYPKHHLASFLVQSAARYPDKAALWLYGKSISYRRLLEECYRFANGVRGLGLAPGDRIAIMLPNCPQAVIGYYGSLMAGLVVVQTNPMYTAREIKHQMRDSGAKAILTVDPLFPRIQEALPDTGLESVIVTSMKDYLPTVKGWLYPIQARRQGQHTRVVYGDGVLAWHSLLSGASAAPVTLPEDASEDLALIQYTGGTTGVAKGVMLTHGNLVANTVQCHLWSYRMREGQEVFLAALPFFHVFGMTVTMNHCILLGGTMILMPRFQATEILQMIHRFKPTVFPGTPTMYIALLNHPDIKFFDISSLEVCISGAAPLPAEIQEKFEALSNGRLIEGYGLSECSPITHANNLWEKRKMGIGIPYPDTDARVVDPDGRPLPPDEIGELIVRGPQVMVGYWNRPVETASTLRDGWLYTGDLARMDRDGFFEIVGRRKDLIIAGGFNIYPREVEEVLYEHPAIEEAVVVGLPDPYRGETVAAYVTIKSGAHVSMDQLNEWCRARLAAFKVPRHIEIRESLPKSAIGKVLRYKLVEEASAKGDARSDTDASEQGGAS